MKASSCTKCEGTGWYEPPNQRGTIHRQVCDACCKHDKGRWQLKEHYGEDNGKWCCIAGCGKTWETEHEGGYNNDREEDPACALPGGTPV